MTVAELVVKIVADTKGFVKGIAEAAGEMELLKKEGDKNSSMGERLSKAFSKLGDLGTFIAKHWIIAAGAFLTAGSTLTSLGGAFASAIPMVSILAGAIYILITPFTILASIIIGLVAPITTLVGLLGLLGGAFYLSFQTAAAGHGKFAEFGHDVTQLAGRFKALLRTLATDFMPIFERLLSAASMALTYFNQLAHMPLEQAMRSLATKGVRMLADFLEHVGSVVARPIRLAIKIAFDNNAMSTQLQHLMNSITGFFTGETVHTHVNISPQAKHGIQVPVMTQQAGALDPILKWWDKNGPALVARGKRWGHEVGQAFGSAIVNAIGPLILHNLEGIFRRWNPWTAFQRYEAKAAAWIEQNWRGTLSSMASKAESLMGTAWDKIKSMASTTWNAIKSAAGKAWGLIVGFITGTWTLVTGAISGGMSTAWEAIKSTAQRIWNDIVSIVESPLHVSISWPSPPSWVTALGHKLGIPGFAGGVTNFAGGLAVVGEHGPELVSLPRGSSVIPNHQLGQASSGGGMTVILNINNPTFLSGGRPAARELARTLKPELDRIAYAR